MRNVNDGLVGYLRKNERFGLTWPRFSASAGECGPNASASLLTAGGAGLMHAMFRLSTSNPV